MLKFLIPLITIFLLAIGVHIHVIRVYNATGPLQNDTIFLVRNNMSLKEISKNLFNGGVIVNPYIFRYVTQFYFGSRGLKTGEYEIEKGSSMSQIAEKIMYGKVLMHSISFPEGFTVKQMARRLKDNPLLVGELPLELPLEGTLCPSTYNFPLGTHRSEILNQAMLKQKQVVDEVWEIRDVDHPIKSKEDLVILASIVEKETSRADERAHVASVFINRFSKSIRLQSDSTVIYGILEGDYDLTNRKISRSDFSIKTPYNSYLMNGLPPTAISNPGRLSLEAVAKPLHTEDLYFVGDGKGGHFFSTNFKDHTINVQKWRKMSLESKP
ncbi:aminodeoxychorismate lyase [Candidatus Liberibacter asiaticus str. psy62]|uniref:Endolytic murein transglycosylase n=1 Tax=Liberibacter asiaticus (strain psy62) TaxID=537021 RepID=C6XF53_LIBAP|nr:aminodeoxychorismate lyase [Candidatus Liberibacter asiaticus str. psy62]